MTPDGGQVTAVPGPAELTPESWPLDGRSLLDVSAEMPIGKTGRIIEGKRYVGRFLRVEGDGEGSFLVITSTKRNFEHGELDDEVWDDWVQNESELSEYFAALGYVVEWLD